MAEGDVGAAIRRCPFDPGDAAELQRLVKCAWVAGRNLNQLSAWTQAKAQFVKVLADAFAFCDDVFSSTTDENAVSFIRQGPNEITRAMALYGLLAHNSEIYGIGTVYLRLKGIVPPSTERQNAARGRSGRRDQ